MLYRLFKAIRYVFTGSLERAPAPTPASTTKAHCDGEMLAPSTFDAPEGRLINDTTYTILKDTHTADDGSKTAVEINSDAIIIETSEGTETLSLSAQDVSMNNVDEDVRLQIARKISLLLPELAESKKEQLMRHVFRVLFVMAEDQLPRIRQMIAEELRDSHDAPPELIRKLAWDEELEVAAPILEFSPLLGDSDLLEIIANSEIPGVVEAVSRRQEVSTDVTDAIIRNVTHSRVDEDDARVINNLLSNKRAHFNEKTLEIVVEEAPNYEIWHESLLDRPELTTRTINKIARFVSEAMIMDMEDRGMITKELGENLTKAIASRLYNPHIDREKEADRQAINLFTQGDLDSQYVMAALDSGEREFVVAAISLLADVPKSATKKIIDSDNPKDITALAWKSGISMRDAIQLQLKLAKIHYSKLLYARDGKYFPLSEGEMLKILSVYLRQAA
ncbi:MAG: DUF2336 domain-containing protein [Alphaproteobacteria bacterium]|nr:DUF2336 domain-containing protein [Alphaproteobacteria bacterium]